MVEKKKIESSNIVEFVAQINKAVLKRRKNKFFSDKKTGRVKKCSVFLLIACEIFKKITTF